MAITEITREQDRHARPAKNVCEKRGQGRAQHQGDRLEDVHLGGHIRPLAIVVEHLRQESVVARGDRGIQPFPDHDHDAEIDQQTDGIIPAIEGRGEDECKSHCIRQSAKQDVRDAPSPAGARPVGQVSKRGIVEGIVDRVDEPESGIPCHRQVLHIHDVEGDDARDGFGNGCHAQADERIHDARFSAGLEFGNWLWWSSQLHNSFNMVWVVSSAICSHLACNLPG